MGLRMRRTLLPARREERGQTLIFVAVALVSLLGMAALAIDVVTLYVAKSEAQRAADAAALAGATAFVSAGATTYPSGTSQAALLNPLGANMASSFIAAALAQNNVSGSPPQPVGSPTIDYTTYPGNPHITVTVQQTNLPTFFARIWGKTSASVQATATAEAYNSSSSLNSIGSYIPVSPRCVKPILILNNDPNGTPPDPFVVETSGAVSTPASSLWGTGFIGEYVSFSSACNPAGAGCSPNVTVGYVPAAIPAPSSSSGANGSYNSTVCPGDCATLGGSSYQQSISCCDTTLYNFNQCGNGAQSMYYDISNNPDNPAQTQNGLQCVVHASAGLPIDALNIPSTYPTDPFHINPGTYTQTALGLGAATNMSTSDSIVTLPIIDPGIITSGGPTVIVVGFLQLFVTSVPGTVTGSDFSGFILNVIGCGNGATAGAISGGGVSPVPVRLITPP